MSEIVGEVAGVNFYPIKSCQKATINGEYPDMLEVGVTGFQAQGFFDRGFMVADEDRLFVSQRGWDKDDRVKHPDDKLLATVSVDVNPGFLQVGSETVGDIPIFPVELDGGQPIDMFSRKLYGIDVGEESADFFSELLGRKVRLYQMLPQLVDERYRTTDVYNMTRGADGFPFLVVNQNSLDDAHESAGLESGTLPIDAYRANIVLTGLGPWVEDKIKTLRIGSFGGEVVKACARCPIPNKDQLTGEQHGLSNKLLRGLRTGWRSDQDMLTEKSGIYFGQNLTHYFGTAGTVVREDMQVEVVGWRQPNFITKN